MNKSILVVGSINMDLVANAPRHPQPGETLLGSSFATFPGGKGANQAVAAARLGGNVHMIGRVGADDFGRQMRAVLGTHSVGTQQVTPLTGVPTGVALITVDARGQNTIVVVPGANAELSPESLNQARGLFDQAGVLVCQLEIPLATVRAAVSLARAAGAKVILNPAPAQPLDEALLRQVDYLIPNQPELALLSGERDVLAGAHVLLRKGVGCVVTTRGQDGVTLVDDLGEEHVPAFRVTAVDTVAAGDAFVGAFAVALNEGQDRAGAVRWGCAAGALAVTRKGAIPSLPNRAELESLLKDGRPA